MHLLLPKNLRTPCLTFAVHPTRINQAPDNGHMNNTIHYVVAAHSDLAFLLPLTFIRQTCHSNYGPDSTYLPGNKMKQVRSLGHLAFKRKQSFVAKPAKKCKKLAPKDYNRKLSDRCKGFARPWCHGENTRQCVTLGFAVVFLPFFASMLWPWPRSLYICLQT